MHRPVGPGAQGDRGRPDDGRIVAPRRLEADGDRGLGLRQGPLGIAVPEGMLGKQPARDELVEPVGRPERLDPGLSFRHRRVVPRHIDEQGHGRQVRLGHAGHPDGEGVGDLLGVIPLAVGEVALEMQVLHV